MSRDMRMSLDIVGRFVTARWFTCVTCHLDRMGRSLGPREGAGWHVKYYHSTHRGTWRRWIDLSTFSVPLTSQDPQSLPWGLEKMWVNTCWINEIQAKQEPELNEIIRNHRCVLKDPFSRSAHPPGFARATASLWAQQQYFTAGTESHTPKFTWWHGVSELLPTFTLAPITVRTWTFSIMSGGGFGISHHTP